MLLMQFSLALSFMSLLPNPPITRKAFFRRSAITVVLLLFGFFLAWLGQWVLDRLMAIAPQWDYMIERVGSGLIGLICVVAVLIPIFRMYGIFDKHK